MAGGRGGRAILRCDLAGLDAAAAARARACVCVPGVAGMGTWPYVLHSVRKTSEEEVRWKWRAAEAAYESLLRRPHTVGVPNPSREEWICLELEFLKRRLGKT